MNRMHQDTRNRELALIHIAKKQLGLDDGTYEAMLWTCGRVKSSKDLDYAGRQRVIEHLKNKGFKVDKAKVKHAGRPHNMGSETRGPQLSKIEALLADAGREWAYADGMAKHMFKVDRVALCHEGQLQKLIAALTYDQKRRAKKTLANQEGTCN